MSAGTYKKMFKQLRAKPAKLKKYLKHNAPKQRDFGIASKECKLCGRLGGHIQKYNLGICRQCFREHAKKLGFKKYY
jgi:small subunit ribosomal protein S14